MYTKYDLAEAYGMGVKEANLYNSSFSEYDLAEAYEMGVKEAATYISGDDSPNERRRKNFFQRHPYLTTFLASTPGSLVPNIASQYLDREAKENMTEEELNKGTIHRNPRTAGALTGAYVGQALAGHSGSFLGSVIGATLGHQSAKSASFSEYDLAEAYEMGVKEANLYNSSFLRR